MSVASARPLARAAQAGIEVRYGGEPLVCLAERAVFAPRHATLFVADVHLGKAQSLRSAGRALPLGHDACELARLEALLGIWLPRRLVVLGDWVHGRAGLTPALEEAIRAFRARHRAVEMALVAGNHDRSAGLQAHAWGFDAWPAGTRLGGLSCWHEPPDETPRVAPDRTPALILCGHVHPALRLAGGADGLILPCFWWRSAARLLVLPAFGSLTGGALVELAPGEEGIVIAGERLFRCREPRRATRA
ncbi:MAG: ligase-associated DNA damage response endonuclease PdeM [Casimicrobiaceae bacterium]|nr:ligase-associated DNA damage response endonuclease PdeM [Casimicrobiaceae bacterium]